MLDVQDRTHVEGHAKKIEQAWEKAEKAIKDKGFERRPSMPAPETPPPKGIATKYKARRASFAGKSMGRRGAKPLSVSVSPPLRFPPHLPLLPSPDPAPP